MDKRAIAKECGQPLEAGKDKEMDSQSESTERNAALLTTSIVPGIPILNFCPPSSIINVK